MIDVKKLLLSGTKEVLISIDWISITSRRVVKSLQEIAHPNLVHSEAWSECSPQNGYSVGIKHLSGVRLYNNPRRDDMGYHFVAGGSALRKSLAYGVTAINMLDYHVRSKDNIARIDIAIDFINHKCTVDDFLGCYKSGTLKTRLKDVTSTKSLSGKGETLYIGSVKNRKKLVRVYDKASEQGVGGLWVRAEAQIMGKPATVAGQHIVKSTNKGRTMIGIVKGVADFQSVEEWNQLSDNIDRINIGTVSSEKGGTRKWLLESVVPALAREVAIDDGIIDEFNNALEVEFRRLGVKGR